MDLLLENLRNPALLFFFLGLISVRLKSDLEIPSNSSRFISIYLLFAIGFKGGQELAHSNLDSTLFLALSSGVVLALLVPFYTFFILKPKLGVQNAGAIAAAYGSVSAVTFVTCISFLDLLEIQYSGYMVAVMAIMEAPSIIIGVILISLFDKINARESSFGSILHHSLTNGSVLLVIGSLIIGYLASDSQAEGIKPFTTDIFKGFLAVFLLDMGITSGKRLKSLLDNGWFTLLFAVIIPFINGTIIAFTSKFILVQIGDRLLLSILAASASYIAVPAAMKMAAPKANPSLYIPMALAITFPFNITFGMPWYLYLIESF